MANEATPICPHVEPKLQSKIFQKTVSNMKIEENKTVKIKHLVKILGSQTEIHNKVIIYFLTSELN